MWLLCVSVLACLLWPLLDASLQLQLNPGSTIYEDILAVTHSVEDRTLAIQLKSDRRCKEPMYLVRLSGAALMLADFQSTDGEVSTFKYPCIVDAGTYFIEVIILHCRAFNPSNYAGICVETVFSKANVVTLPYSVKLGADAGCEARPRWKQGTNASGEPFTPTFLPTRHQIKLTELAPTEHCDTGIVEGFCNPDNFDLEEYNRYEWVDAPQWSKQLETILANGTNPVIHMCYVGDSHSGELARFGRQLTSHIANLTHSFVLDVLPSMFRPEKLITHKCSIAIISFGQWSFSNAQHPAITKEKYASDLRKLVGLGGLTKDAGPTKVYFRTENFNGLGARYTSCPPLDYRSIPAIRMLNDVIRELSVELNLNFIDLTHIQAVHWDGAADFNHPAHRVFDAELNWILHHVFSHIIDTQAEVVTYAEHDEPHLPKHNPFQYKKDLQDALHALALPA